MADIGTLTPDQLAQQQQVLRQQKMAEMLLQSGFQQPQGQMVSGRYVAPSITQNLANLANIYAGKTGIEKAEKAQLDLAERLRATQATEAQNIVGALKGTPEVAAVVPEGQTLRDDQGNLTMGSQVGTPAVAGSRDKALMEALKGRSQFSQSMAGKLLEQDFKEPKFEKIEQYDPKTGNTIIGMVNVNSPNPEATYRPIGVSKPAMSAKDRAELADKGIIVGGGSMSMGGGQASGQGGQQPTGDAKYMPTNLPTYEYDTSLSPADNRALQVEFSKGLKKNVQNAKDSFGSIKAVSEILKTNDPSSGFFENVITGTREMFGGGGKQSQADAKLKVLGQKLVQQVPRFEGPQSDKDVASYQAAAGDIGNPNRPIAARLAALQTLVDLNKKYYPNGDWDSINLEVPKIKPNMLGGTNTYFGATVEAPSESGWRVKK